ncbi:MAG: hypothetical protein ACYC6Y_02125 [Thermoguttaceae bacterium]
MIPKTTTRVRDNTDERVNASIRQQMDESVASCALAGPAAIDRRLRELDEEWDVERVLEANAASLALAGVILGTIGSRRWFIVPAVVTTFLLQHAVQGWCPPLPILRRLGFRTEAEIQRERYALKALRGDFLGVKTPTREAGQTNVSAALQGVDL